MVWAKKPDDKIIWVFEMSKECAQGQSRAAGGVVRRHGPRFSIARPHAKAYLKHSACG